MCEIWPVYLRFLKFPHKLTKLKSVRLSPSFVADTSHSGPRLYRYNLKFSKKKQHCHPQAKNRYRSARCFCYKMIVYVWIYILSMLKSPAIGRSNQTFDNHNLLKIHVFCDNFDK